MTLADPGAGDPPDVAVPPDAPVTPDTKDWTWVLERPCPACGFAPASVVVTRLGPLIEDDARAWRTVLAGGEATRLRPAPGVWSPLEYACHVRDVLAMFGQRLRLMIEQDDPVFDNWDQDATAVAEGYARADPATVADQLSAAAVAAAAGFDAVGGDQWGRPGRRSNGSRFTVATLGVYFLHDLVHHRHDVTGHRWSPG